MDLQGRPVSGAPPPDPWVPILDARPRPQAEEWNWFGASSTVRRGRLPFTAGGTSARLGRAFSAVAVAITLVMLAYSIVASVAGHFAAAEPVEGRPLTRGDLLVDILFSLGIFLIPPLIWVATWYAGGPLAWRDRLFMRFDRAFGDFGWGVIGGFVLLFLTVVIALTAESITDQPENEPVKRFGAIIDWPLVFMMAAVAGIGEEIFFRGFLQPRIGIVPANVLFGLVHLSYGTPLQVIVPGVLGFGFSFLMIKRGSVIPAIVAHFTYNLIMLSLAKLYFG